jgi:hypothetical protein
MALNTIASLKQEETVISLKDKGSIEDSLDSLNDFHIEWKA